MLIKADRGSPMRAQQRDWLTRLSIDQNMVTSTLLNDKNRPVSTESTVVVYYHGSEIGKQKNGDAKMRGARRVVAFCLLTAAIPMMLVILPLYLRNSVFAERNYSFLESDVTQLGEGISSFFCQGHGLKAVEGRFSAFQMVDEPGIASERRAATIERQMVIPDDRLEYWGFHFMPKSFLNVAVCSSSPGARLLVVRGEKNLELCGMLQPQLSMEVTAPPVLENDEITFEEHIEEEPSDLDEAENIAAEVTDGPIIDVAENLTTEHKHRHERSRLRGLMAKIKRETPEEETNTTMRTRFNHLSDIAHFEGAMEHGGNADWNVTEPEGGSSVSSFESGLLTCFKGKTLFQRGFESSGKLCEEDEWSGSMLLSQTVRTQGHFYYVFYSDNDLDINHIKARFQINATRLDFSSAPNSCTNATECQFKRSFFGGDGTVYLEAESDLELVSTCEPRIAVYLMFPVCAIVFVLIFGLI